MNFPHGIENSMVLQIPLGTSILIQGSLHLNQGGRNRQRVFLENFQFRRTCWMKQRTANNNFIPSTINFHNQISDTALDTELIAVESHTWQGCIKPGCKVREKFSLHHSLEYLGFFWKKILLEEAWANIYHAPKGALSHCPESSWVQHWRHGK